MSAHDCPYCKCGTWQDEPIPQPSTSSAWARTQALDAAAAAVRNAKESRKRPAEETR